MKWFVLIAMIGVLAIQPAGMRFAVAQDCPNAQTAPEGFIVERGANARNEVLRDAAAVRTIYRVGDRVLLETTQYEGLFELDRIDRGRRSTFKPKTDLSKLFPLKEGRRLNAEFEVNATGAPATKRVISLHILDADELYVGKCKYKVFKIEHNEARGDAHPTFFDFYYYAPELKLIVAKEFKAPGGRTSLNKYEKIYPLGN